MYLSLNLKLKKVGKDISFPKYPTISNKLAASSMASALFACNQTMLKPRSRGSCAILAERTYLIASARTITQIMVYYADT